MQDSQLLGDSSPCAVSEPIRPWSRDTSAKQGLLEARTRRHRETIKARAGPGATEAVHVRTELDR
eukprot:616344-Pyramimonas_sp.AAC.1